MSWTKQTALSELRALAEQAKSLEDVPRFSAQHTRWLAKTSLFLQEVFGGNSSLLLNFSAYQWAMTGSFMVGGPGDPEGAWNPQAAIERMHQEAYVKQLDGARGLLLAAADYLERTDLKTVYEGKDTGPESSAILKVINLAERRLRKVIKRKPDRESEVQDAFEALLVGADIPYSRESERIEYSSKTYTPDFTVPKIDLAVELKLCSKEGREKEMIAEINDDILAYQTKYGNLLFVVYDLGFIRDVDRFASSIEENENVIVRIVKH